MPRPYYSNIAFNSIIEQPASETGQSQRRSGQENRWHIWPEHVNNLVSTPGPNWANTGMVITLSSFFPLWSYHKAFKVIWNEIALFVCYASVNQSFCVLVWKKKIIIFHIHRCRWHPLSIWPIESVTMQLSNRHKATLSASWDKGSIADISPKT